MMVQVPDGYVLVRRGGRPTKHARDIAVFLAVKWHLERDPKKWRAAEWALLAWPELADEAGVRKAERKACGRLPKSYVLQVSAAGAILFETLPGVLLPRAGGVLWVWSEGEAVAAEYLLRNVRQSVDWQQTYSAWAVRHLFGGGGQNRF